MEFHIQYNPPNPALPHWPKGCWSLYRITGEQIAERTIWTKASGKYEVAERWPWPGFDACFHTLEELAAAIQRMVDEA